MDFFGKLFGGKRESEVIHRKLIDDSPISREDKREIIKAEEISGHLSIRMERDSSRRAGENTEKNGEGNITMLDANVLVSGIKIEVHLIQNVVDQKGAEKAFTQPYRELTVTDVKRVGNEICISTIDSNRVERKFYVQKL